MAEDKTVDEVIDEVVEKYDSQKFEVKTLLFGSFGSFPPSRTEQIHSASISEQIRAGQGTAIEPENNRDMYDFPDGRDDGSDAIGIFDLSEPADVFERESDFRDNLRALSEAQKQASNASSTASDSKKSNSSQKSSQNQSSSELDGVSESTEQ